MTYYFSNRFILIIPYLKGGEEMRPKRYPYSGKKESTFVKADSELVEKLLRNTSYLESLLAERVKRP